MSRDSPERKELLEKLSRGGRQLSAATIMFHQAVADQLGLHPTDHKCADFLFLKGPMTAGELAELTGLTTGAITGVIDRLAEAGFVRREEDANDRRRVIVRVVPERFQEVAPLFESLAKTMNEVCAHFTDQELAVILDFQTRAHQGVHAATAELRRQSSGKRGKRPGGAKGSS
jgi:DNA-binding MarR family transcriptional regulator